MVTWSRALLRGGRGDVRGALAPVALSAGRKGLKPGGSCARRPGGRPGKPWGKAPSPRKGKMSCLMVAAGGGEEPPVAGVKYLGGGEGRWSARQQWMVVVSGMKWDSWVCGVGGRFAGANKRQLMKYCVPGYAAGFGVVCNKAGGV